MDAVRTNDTHWMTPAKVKSAVEEKIKDEINIDKDSLLCYTPSYIYELDVERKEERYALFGSEEYFGYIVGQAAHQSQVFAYIDLKTKVLKRILIPNSSDTYVQVDSTRSAYMSPNLVITSSNIFNLETGRFISGTTVSSSMIIWGSNRDLFYILRRSSSAVYIDKRDYTNGTLIKTYTININNSSVTAASNTADIRGGVLLTINNNGVSVYYCHPETNTLTLIISNHSFMRFGNFDLTYDGVQKCWWGLATVMNSQNITPKLMRYAPLGNVQEVTLGSAVYTGLNGAVSYEISGNVAFNYYGDSRFPNNEFFGRYGNLKNIFDNPNTQLQLFSRYETLSLYQGARFFFSKGRLLDLKDNKIYNITNAPPVLSSNYSNGYIRGNSTSVPCYGSDDCIILGAIVGAYLGVTSLHDVFISGTE